MLNGKLIKEKIFSILTKLIVSISSRFAMPVKNISLK